MKHPKEPASSISRCVVVYVRRHEVHFTLNSTTEFGGVWRDGLRLILGIVPFFQERKERLHYLFSPR